ncbi:hypothetical protein Trydic_g17986 [Trypoxylus dichotomus]
MDIRFSNIPLTLHKDVNTILLSWESLVNEYEDVNVTESHLFISTREGWKFLFRGTKTQYLVRSLEPSTCYTFKLKIYDGNKQVDNIKFRASTDFEPYYNFHITRAVSRSKATLLRKVVAQRPLLLELENRENKTPLAMVAENDDLPMANLLITLGANVNTPLMWNNRTPLMISIFHGNLQIATLLLDKGADVSIKDCNGLTAMHYAVDSGNLENVQFIVEHGLDINVVDSKGWSGLLRAVVMDCSDKIIRYLVENGADLSVNDKNGFNFYKHCEISGRVVNLENVEEDEKSPTPS